MSKVDYRNKVLPKIIIIKVISTATTAKEIWFIFLNQFTTLVTLVTLVI